MFDRMYRPIRRGFAIAATLLVLSLTASAQTARNVGIVPDAERARVGFDPAESAGLFVGIREFDDVQFTEVPYAVDDAVDLAHLFAFDLKLVPAEKIVLALSGEPQKVASRARLDALREAGAAVEEEVERSDLYRLLPRQARNSGERGLFVVAVASRGFLDASSAHLVTRDSVRGAIDKTGFEVNDLLAMIGAAESPRQLVLLDACRERLTKRRSIGSAAAFGRPFVEAIEEAKGRVVLAAATEDGFAYDDPERKNGVFTAAVLDGLRGAAAPDERGFITVTSLANFAQERVASWVRRHRPGDLERSRGITQTLGGPAAELPLAVDPAFSMQPLRFEDRKATALDRLKLEIGDVITGQLYDEVSSLLASADPETAEPWLDRIEALNGELALQESFAYFYEQVFDDFGPPPMRMWPQEPESFLALEADNAARDNTDERRAMRRPASTSTSPEAGDVWVDPAIGMRFRYVPAGTFLMGSPEDEPGRFDNETQHEVTLTRGFWMGETEVTQAQWKQVMGNNPSGFKACGDDCPVETVNWFEAVAFANALSRKAGRTPCYEASGGNGKDPGEGLEYEKVEWIHDCDGYRLPTEAEWERAARAGTNGAIYGSDVDSIAWYSDNSDLSTHPVAKKQPNRWGLHDVLGNVWEWTWDWYGAYAMEEQVDPVGPAEGSGRVLRGGSWYSDARFVRAAYRLWCHPGVRFSCCGFRLSSGPVRASPEGAESP